MASDYKSDPLPILAALRGNAYHGPSRPPGKVSDLGLSPNYPAIGLRAAVDKISILYKKDGLAPCPKGAALGNLGFEKEHGEAGRMLSALKSFGLIEEADAQIKLAQRGIDIVVRQTTDPKRAEALRDAVAGPDIYREILKQYQQSGLPSDSTMKSWLIAVKRFNPNAVEALVRDFKDTLEFAGLSDLAAVELGLEDEEKMLEQVPTANPVNPPPAGKIEKPMPNSNLLAQTLPVSIPRNLRVDVQVRGDQLRREDLDKIKSQFNRWIEGLEEAFSE